MEWGQLNKKFGSKLLEGHQVQWRQTSEESRNVASIATNMILVWMEWHVIKVIKFIVMQW